MPDSTGKANASNLGSSVGWGDMTCNEPEVNLVSFDPGLPPRLAVVDPDSQCDCACFAVEGEMLPTLRIPVSFYLELTPICNNRCPSCGNVFAERGPYRALRSMPPPLSAKEWGQTLKKLQPHAYRLKLTGGEPTAHPEFETIVNSVSALDVPFTILTNGRWPAPERLCTLLKNMPGFQGFLVSLHGPTPVSHQAFTREPSSFAETVANIRMAIQSKLPVSLSCTITRHNWNLVDEMLKKAKGLGVDSIVFNRYLGPDVAGLAPSPQALRATIHSIRALRAAGEPVKFGNCVPACFASTKQPGCLAGTAFFTIDPWGQVRPCNHAPLLCGNIMQRSVEEIWQSPNMDWWRSFRPAQCRHCDAFATCGGGCRAQAMALNQDQDPLMAHPLCLPKVQPGTRWTFYEQARPIAHFSQRPEEFGTLLIFGNRLFPVNRDMQNVLNALDGQSTLRQIEAAHGPGALALIASLYQQGMVELEA